MAQKSAIHRKKESGGPKPLDPALVRIIEALADDIALADHRAAATPRGQGAKL